MNLPQKVPTMTVMTAIVALLLALPASAQTPNSSPIASNAAAQNGSTLEMVKTTAAPMARASTGTQTAGSAAGNDPKAKVTNELK